MKRTNDPPWLAWYNNGFDYQNPFHAIGGSCFYNEKTTAINKLKFTQNAGGSFVTQGMIRHFKKAIT